MKALGLSFDFHDASAAVVQDGTLVASAAEERFTLQKHDASYPWHAIESVLKLAQTDCRAIDAVAFYERPHDKFTRVLHSSYSGFPRGSGFFSESMKKWLSKSLWTRNAVAARLEIDPRRITFFPHHHSHVAQAFNSSPFEESAVLIVDGVGEWTTTTLAYANRREGIKVLEQFEYPESLGLVYAAFTAFLGFKPNSAEASTMALAGFGRPLYVEEIRQVLRTNADGTYNVCTDFLNFLSETPDLFTPVFRRVFGEPRSIRSGAYGFDVLKDEQREIALKDQYYADIAASLQVVLTEVLLGLARRLRQRTDVANLCFAGGVALNCLANTEILKRSGFENLFIPSDPGDGGAAAGAAVLAVGMSAPCLRATPYLGALPDLTAIDALLDSSYLRTITSAGVSSSDEVTIERVHFDELPEVVADKLARGAIVGWVQGRFESGPRALGNRSLLVDPGNVNAVRRMSATVKSHGFYRPYALSIAGEAAGDVLLCDHLNQPVLRWMQTVWPVLTSVRERVRGGIHVDGTTRPQLCWRDDNPLFWQLLMAFGRRSGLPVLVNTSFNERSMPMVASSVEALLTFLRTGIDVLVVEDLVLSKANIHSLGAR
jgi:carbamoyltransferase